MKKYVVFICSLIVLCTSTYAHANLSSTFNANTEGWTGDDPTNHDWGFVTWISSGGNPGGFIQGREDNPTGGTGYFMAPSSWNGNWSQYIGGQLKYDINIINGTSYFVDDDVRIYNGSNYVAWRSGVNPVGLGWYSFGVDLTAANFGGNVAAFNSVMSNVTAFWIRGEYINGTEIEGLDNVSVTAPVPIPGAVLLFGPGLVGLAAIRKRFKK